MTHATFGPDLAKRCDGFPQAWGQYAEQSLFQLINIVAVGIQPMTRLWSALASSQHPAGMAISMRASDHRLITRTRPAAPPLSDKAPSIFLQLYATWLIMSSARERKVLRSGELLALW